MKLSLIIGRWLRINERDFNKGRGNRLPSHLPIINVWYTFFPGFVDGHHRLKADELGLAVLLIGEEVEDPAGQSVTTAISAVIIATTAR